MNFFQFYLSDIKKITQSIYQKYPLFFFSINFTLGLSCYLFNRFLWLFLFIFLLFDKKKVSLIFFVFGILYSFFLYYPTKNIDSPLSGEAIFKIKDKKEIYSFSRYYKYTGILKKFKTDKTTYKNLNCTITSKENLNANYLYQLTGDLQFNRSYYFFIKKPKITKLKKILSLSEIRYQLKKSFFYHLKNHIKDNNSYNFLNAIITADHNGKLLSFCFAKVGLQHVLAISGFHFGIFILFFSFFLNLFCPKKISLWILLIIINLYFIFVGPLASIQRSYLMIELVLISQLINRNYSSLNALGFALLVITLINPLIIANIGFQLSFLASFAILAMQPNIDAYFSKYLKKRNFNELQKLNLLSKKAYLLSSFLRQSIALSLSVNILLLPLLLFHFHKFSIISFIYNIFIPPLVGISMVLIILGFLTSFIPIFSDVIYYLCTIVTEFTLRLVIQTPAFLQFYIRTKELSYVLVVSYTFLMILLFLFMKIKYLKNKEFEYLKIL